MHVFISLSYLLVIKDIFVIPLLQPNEEKSHLCNPQLCPNSMLLYLSILAMFNAFTLESSLSSLLLKWFWSDNTQAALNTGVTEP